MSIWTTGKYPVFPTKLVLISIAIWKKWSFHRWACSVNQVANSNSNLIRVYLNNREISRNSDKLSLKLKCKLRFLILFYSSLNNKFRFFHIIFYFVAISTRKSHWSCVHCHSQLTNLPCSAEFIWRNLCPRCLVTSRVIHKGVRQLITAQNAIADSCIYLLIRTFTYMKCG